MKVLMQKTTPDIDLKCSILGAAGNVRKQKQLVESLLAYAVIHGMNLAAADHIAGLVEVAIETGRD